MKTQFFAHILSIGAAFSWLGRQVGAEDFVGPGGLSCVQGVCKKSSDCIDFGTYTSGQCNDCNVKDFAQLPGASVTTGYGSIREVDSCYLEEASNLNAEEPIEIYAGCCISCTGCTFIDYLATFSGPGWLECKGGKLGEPTADGGKCLFQDSKCPGLHSSLWRVSTGGWDFENSGAVENSGSAVVSAPDFDKIVHYNIITKEPIKLEEGCTVQCSSCTFTPMVHLNQKTSMEPEYVYLGEPERASTTSSGTAKVSLPVTFAIILGLLL